MRGEGGLRAYQLILNLERTGSTRAVPTRGSWSGQRCEAVFLRTGSFLVFSTLPSTVPCPC